MTYMKSMLLGSLLGDGSVVFSNKRSKNAMYKLKQCSKYKSYVEYVYEKLNDYVSCGIRVEKSKKPSKVNGKICNLDEYWDGTYCEAYYFWTKCDAIFTKLRNEWYPNSVKKIPRNLRLNKDIVSHWYVEDGSNNVTKKSKGINFSTHCFSHDDCMFLVDRFKEDLGLTAKIYNGPIVRIMSNSYFDFIDLVSDKVKEFGCFNKKIDTSIAPKDRVGKSWIGAKLNFEIAEEIRYLRHCEKVKLKCLSEKYCVTISTISKIVNNQMYFKKSILIGGSSIVKIGYKYGN